MRFGKRKATVERLVLEHLAQVRESVDRFAEAARALFVDKDADEAGRLALETHRTEGRADDLRREVQRALISGALLAPSRGQILKVIDGVDTLANAAESTLDYLLVQRVDIPGELADGVLQILDVTLDIFEEVECAVRLLFTGPREKTIECTERIEHREGKVDQIERDLTKRLFRLDIDLGHKLHVFGYIERLVEISDRAEDLADRIALVIAERVI